MADNTTPDLDELLNLTDDDLPTEAVVSEDEPMVEAAPEPKKRAPRKPRAQKEPEEVVAEPGHIPTETINPTESTESPEQRRIRELEAELARPSLKPTTDGAGRPLPEKQLDEEQRRIRELEDRVARKRAEDAESAETQYVAPDASAEVIKIHFLKDGLLVNGVTTYRGQEMDFEINGLAHNQTKNRHGWSFLDLLDDIDGQFDRWGEQYIARGPWRGRAWGDTSTLNDPEAKAAAAAAARAEARRNHAAPITVL